MSIPKKWVGRGVALVTGGSAIATVLTVLAIMGIIVYGGIGHLSWDFIF